VPTLTREQVDRATASTRKPTHRSAHGLTARLIHWARLTVGVGLFAALLSLALLVLADYDIAGNGSPNVAARLSWVWARGDHLHFAVHIAQARLLDICPCTRRAAGYQYYKAHFHAVTAHQRALAADTNPHSLSDWAEYVVGPVVVGFDWIHDGIVWITGQRPTQQATVIMDEYEFEPPEIHVARGTLVTWRNVDEEGEAHTITADPGQSVRFDSGWVLPDETFQYTFTERGRYAYFCQAHGAPGQQGQALMTGVIVVE
jgi:plastocyanin